MENNENVTEPTPSAPKQMDFNKGIISEKQDWYKDKQ